MCYSAHLVYCCFFFFSSRRRHTRSTRDWSSDVCSSDLNIDPSMLPSKIVSYLSLPIPRVAVTSDPTRDAIGTYLHDKSGWLVLRSEERRVGKECRCRWAADRGKEKRYGGRADTQCTRTY